MKEDYESHKTNAKKLTLKIDEDKILQNEILLKQRLQNASLKLYIN